MAKSDTKKIDKTPTRSTEEKLQIECLLATSTLETYWAYYAQSNGKLYKEEIKEIAKSFLDIYEKLIAINDDYLNESEMWFGDITDAKKWIIDFKKWISSSHKWIQKGLLESRSHLFLFCSGIKNYILMKLGLPFSQYCLISIDEFLYNEESLKWAGHLPNVKYFANIGKTIKSASLSFSITVVGDIRRSQQLLTYSLDPEEYSKRMTIFLSRTREIIEDNNGVFDKFTGDGFIAYFNESICKEAEADYIDSFLSFLKQEREFAKKHFDEWKTIIKVLPDQDIGLAFGADLGRINFQNTNYHFVAVGDVIVWATRMASAAKANQIVVNNLLYQALKDKPNLSFEDVSAPQKYGEVISAKELEFDDKK